MSAINPASFASPSLGLQAPSGIGPGAVGVGRNPPQGAERRAPQDQQPSFGGSPQANRGAFPGGFSQQPFNGDRATIPSNGFSPTAYAYGYSPFSASPRSAGGNAAGFVPMMDPLANFPTAVDYQGIPGRFPSPHGSSATDAAAYGRQPSALGSPGEAWISSFQGLSMNSR